MNYLASYYKSIQNPEAFWKDQSKAIDWFKTPSNILSTNDDDYHQWYEDGTLNMSYLCLDKHISDGYGDQNAIIYDSPVTGVKQAITYNTLKAQVGQLASGLKSLGLEKGDTAIIYMPMIPELMMATLACARIGAVHSVVFAGFSAQALTDRINDSSCKMVITSDGLYRGAKEVPVKRIVDEALEDCESVEKVLVVQRTNWDVNMKPGRDIWYHQELSSAPDECEAEPMDSEDLLFILYTSGSTGKPKGVMHTCGGYMVYAGYSFQNVFQYDPGDVYWCTADIGWITGHTYIVYGPLLNGATTMMFEGVPTYPDAGRFWQICDKHSVNQFYTAPTAIRALMAQGDEHVMSYSLDSLRTIGTVGEPINEEAWHWYNIHIGKERCPVVDTWWQTETGGIMISALGEHGPTKPSYAGYPLPGVQPVLLDQDGNEITENNTEGYLAIKFPWPSMIRSTYGDHERCRTTYFAQYKGYYFTGDGAKRDEAGMYRIIGRVDDVINVSGHRFGTAEIENAINADPHVAESAVVGYPHDIKGQGIYAYVICKKQPDNEENLRAEIIETVKQEIGPIAKPDKIQFVTGLPKTRSGKIMRRILRKVAEGEPDKLGDISTLLDPNVVSEVVKGAL